MKYKVFISKTAENEFKRLKNKELKRRIFEYINNLEKYPNLPFIKLKGTKNKYRGRVGKYRIIFEVIEDEKEIYVLKIEHRKRVYRDI